MFSSSTGWCQLVCFSRVLFADNVNQRLVKWCQRRDAIWLSCTGIWLPLSVYVCLGTVVEYCPFLDTCTHHSYSKLCCLCLLASLFKLLPTPPHPCDPFAHPLIAIRWPNSNDFHEANCQKLIKISRYYLLCSVNVSNTKARLAF